MAVKGTTRSRSTTRPQSGASRAKKERNTKASAAVRPVTRRAVQGDTAPDFAPDALAKFTAREAAKGAELTEMSALQSVLDSRQKGAEKAKALRALLEGASNDDLAAIQKRLLGAERDGGKVAKLDPDQELAENWRDGGYPYKNLMLRRNYERQK